nr:transposase [Bacteroides zoogleoformans]
MITESKVTEIFCIADDFCKEFEAEMAKNALPSTPDAPQTQTKAHDVGC